MAVMQFDAQPDPARLAMVMGLLPPPIDSDHIVPAALFAVFASQRWGEVVAPRFPFVAAAVLASGEWQLSLIPVEVIAALEQGLLQCGEDNFPALFLGHQGNLMRLLETLERLKAAR
jgi:hypothetical protein